MVNKNEPHNSSRPKPAFYKLGHWGPDCNQSLKSYSCLVAKLLIYSIFGMVRLCCNKQHHIFTFLMQWKFIWPFHQGLVPVPSQVTLQGSCLHVVAQRSRLLWSHGTHILTHAPVSSVTKKSGTEDHASSEMCYPRSNLLLEVTIHWQHYPQNSEQLQREMVNTFPCIRKGRESEILVTAVINHHSHIMAVWSGQITELSEPQFPLF